MKILFVIRSTRTFHYHRSIIAALLDRGHDVRALFDYEWSKTKVGSVELIEAFQKQHPGFQFGWALQRRDFLRHILFPAREILSYRRYFTVPGQSPYYRDRWRRYIPLWLRFLARRFTFTHAIIRMRWVGVVLRRLERVIPPDAGIIQELQKEKPDAVIVSPANLRYSSSDLEYLKAAARLKIPTAVQVLSWDNLTTKGLIHIVPDVVLAWNETQVGEARAHHGISAERVFVTGAPVFDQWFSDLKPSMSREEFCKRHGFDPRYPIIVYLGSTKNIAKDESWLVEKLRESLDSASDERLRKTQLLVRPHPAHAAIYERLSHERIKIVPEKGSPPNSEESLQLFYDSLYYAEATIGVNTSGMIDAAIAGKPGMAILTREYALTQSEAVHFQYLIEGDVLEILHAPEEFPAAISRILAGHDAHKDQRKRFIGSFIRPNGILTTAGEIAAQRIEKLILKKN